MTSPHDDPTQNAAIGEEEGGPTTRPDHREHAKTDPRPDDDALAARAERQRDEIGDGSGDATV